MTSSKLREAITAALGDDRELLDEVTQTVRDRAGTRLASFPMLLQAADALEPVLEEAVRRRPSFLRNIAYGTAHVLSSLASQDGSSNRRLSELAGGSHVGIVFIDMVEFTEYTSSNGDEAAVKLVGRVEDVVTRVCRDHKGEVVKHLGDGFLLAFPSASHAVRGAVALRDEARKMRANDSSLPMVRVAVHAGRPSIERDDLIGNDVNLTARLLSHARPDEVLVTEEAKGLTGTGTGTSPGSLTFSEVGPIHARGLPQAVQAYSADLG